MRPLELLLVMMRMWELRAGSWVLVMEDLLGTRLSVSDLCL